MDIPSLNVLSIALLVVAGVGAGLINTVVGSGSLISFPALLALGYPPVLANVTNNVGVLPGSISGAIGYRHEIHGHWWSLLPMVISAAVGGVAGALLLLVLPAAVFNGIVPVLIALACVLVILGPTLKRRIAARPRKAEDAEPSDSRPSLITATALTGTYGGYFGAAQGVILLSLLSLLLKGSLQRANAVKNMLAATANLTASIVFVALTPIDWLAAGVIAVGAIVGGQLGARLGRKIPEPVLRWCVFGVGVTAIAAWSI